MYTQFQEVFSRPRALGIFSFIPIKDIALVNYQVVADGSDCLLRSDAYRLSLLASSKLEHCWLC